ncbi:uncharacterized protein A4U43_C04F24280 [Asparagus officinalis]|uniref:Uncharacterized protein n=1 Tax=Asparagus officinalis TaxID=4686 RepID=A0A5P1F3X4_ASPOF|nr:uncharacterized protein A4U43_C04F24280 [Asparagus officinalis]
MSGREEEDAEEDLGNSGARDESDDETDEGSAKETEEENEARLRKLGEFVGEEGEFIREEFEVQSTPSLHIANVSLSLTPGGGADTP